MRFEWYQLERVDVAVAVAGWQYTEGCFFSFIFLKKTNSTVAQRVAVAGWQWYQSKEEISTVIPSVYMSQSDFN
jgi:hypothetical protein